MNIISPPTDSPGALNSSLSQPPPMGSMMGHSSVISTSRPLPSPMGYSVIASSMSSSPVSLPSTPAMGYGALNSPKVKILHSVQSRNPESPNRILLWTPSVLQRYSRTEQFMLLLIFEFIRVNMCEWKCEGSWHKCLLISWILHLDLHSDIEIRSSAEEMCVCVKTETDRKQCEG